MPLDLVPPVDNVSHVHQCVVDTLEDVLSQAKDGNIRAVAIAIERPDSSTVTRWSIGIGSSYGLLIGALEMLKVRLVKRADTEAVDE